MNKLLIIGAGGHGKVIADIALKRNIWQEIAFLDDDDTIQEALGLRVLGPVSQAASFVSEYDMVVAIGNHTIREKFCEQLKAAGVMLPVLVHPNATVGSQVEIGVGTVVMAGAVINCDSKVGEGCIVNTAATVDHDCTIEDYTHISPGTHIAGTVKIGKKCWIGIGASVVNNVNIGNGIVIGAGALVISDVMEEGTYIGIPAKKMSDL